MGDKSFSGNLFNFKICLLTLIAAVYLFFASGLPWVDADHQLMVSGNLVWAHSFSVDEVGYISEIRGGDGRYYDTHGITNVLFMTPIAVLEPITGRILGGGSKQFLSFLGALTGVIVNSLVCLVFFSILVLLGRPLRICFYTTLCLAFLTIILPYSSNNYEGNLNMLFMLCSLYFLFAFREKGKTLHLTYSGVFAGLAINTKEFSWIFLFCMLVFILWSSLGRRNIRMIVIFLASLIPFLVLWGYYNWVRTGFFYITPIVAEILSREIHPRSPTGSIISGLSGLLFSKGMSIFIYSPVLLSSVFGWRGFFKVKRKECVLILSITLLFLLANAKLLDWWAVGSWGPRYTLEITPLLMLPLGYWLTADVIKNKIKKCFFLILCACSLLIQLSGTLTNWHGRMNPLIEGCGSNAILYTVECSQWLDSIKTLFINLWNMAFGSFSYIENPGYSPTLSNASLYTSKTVFTWWNRLLFMGANPMWVGVYLAVSFTVALYCMFYLISVIRKSS